MAYINLISWRENAKKAEQTKFFYLLSTIVFCTCMIMFFINYAYHMHIDGQHDRNQFLKSEIKQLDARIIKTKRLNEQKEVFKQRNKVVEKLQSNRNIVTKILAEVARVAPKGVYLTKLVKEKNKLILTGKSKSNNHLADMIRAIELSDLFDSFALNSITTNDTQTTLLSDFTLQISIKPPRNAALSIDTPSNAKVKR